MIHLRIVAPPELAARVLEVLERTASAINVVHLPGSARKPAGDVVLTDVAREEASALLAELRELGVERVGTVAIEEIDVALSERADRIERAAHGAVSDAVVWEEVQARTSESTELSVGFGAFMVLATLIAAIGIMTDSIILIIGAMVVGPEFGPLAGVCVGVVTGRLALARRSVAALALGFPLAIAAAWLLTVALRAADRAADTIQHPETVFISEPSTFSILVAALAGIAGMLSLTTAKSGALLGVLISVTTIPAAANVGVAAAYRNWDECAGAAAQLLINLTTIVVAGTATLALQSAVFRRQRDTFRRRLRRRGRDRA